MKKQYAFIGIATLMLLMTLSAVFARATAEEANMVAKPTSAFSLAMVTESIVYLFSGGIGPILILALLIVLAILIGHWTWS